MSALPTAWQEAFRRDAAGERPALADPLPERRLARLLGAFILAGLIFLVLPGTLLGVWNLVAISSAKEAQAIPRAWIQDHGHAQLFGWVGTFIIGISLYAVPKFRGGFPRSLAVGWVMFGLWTGALLARSIPAARPAGAAAELVVVLLLTWQCTATGRSRNRMELWNRLVFAGFAGLVATLAWQLAAVWRLRGAAIPEPQNALLLHLAVWAFCFPVAWGFSTRFLPTFLGLPQPDARAAHVGLLVLLAGVSLRSPWLILAAVLLACWSLRIFGPAARPAKTAGVDPGYPIFVRAAFAWLVVSAVLAAAGESRGLTGASRHAFTVGFLATLIFSVGPRILPSFLNSRELWSPRLMRAALLLLTGGCLLRVVSEPLAYGGILPPAWSVLPVSAMAELSAVLLFAINIGATLASPMPAWIEAASVHDGLPLYWYVSAYPETRKLLARAGLSTLARARAVPRSLTLREAAEADQADAQNLVRLLREYFARRLARALRAKACPKPS